MSFRGMVAIGSRQADLTAREDEAPTGRDPSEVVGHRGAEDQGEKRTSMDRTIKDQTVKDQTVKDQTEKPPPY